MKKIFWPDYIYSSIYEVDYQKLKALGIKGLAFDIDNTLCVYTTTPDEQVKALFDKLRTDGFIP